jgi:Transposase, Mutator family
VGAASLEGLSLPLSFELDAICLKMPGAGRFHPGAPGLRRGGQGRLPGGVGGGGGWREEERSVRLPASGPKKGVRQVVSDDNESIKAMVFGQLPGAEWQRCVVHFERNVLS